MDSNSVSVLVDHFSAFSLVGRARPHTRGQATKRMLAAVFASPPRVNDDWALNVILLDDTEAAFKVCIAGALSVYDAQIRSLLGQPAGFLLLDGRPVINSLSQKKNVFTSFEYLSVSLSFSKVKITLTPDKCTVLQVRTTPFGSYEYEA